MEGDRRVGAILADLERFREESARRSGLWLMGMGLVAASATTFLLLFVNRGAAAGAATAGVVVLVWIWRRHLASMRAGFKDLLMPRIMARVNPGLDAYDPKGLPREQFDVQELFERPDKRHYKSKDLMGGRIGETAIAFAMVDARKVKRREVATIFRGLVFIADFHKHFHGRTIVNNSGTGSLARLLLDRVDLEDPRFDRAFTVTSTDQVEARYLLTPDLCERLLALRECFDSLDAVFHDSCIVLALGASYDLFEPDMRRPIGVEQFDEMVRGLEEVVGLVEHLELNTRIWSKKPVAQAELRA